MAFIRMKRINGRLYKYEVENVRGVDGSVQQRVLRYLGPETPLYGTGEGRRPAKRG